MNVHGPAHQALRRGQERFSTSNAAFRFAERAEDPALTANRVDPPHVAGNANRPGWRRRRKQTRRAWPPCCGLVHDQARYFDMFAGTADLPLCDHGFRAMAYIIEKGLAVLPRLARHPGNVASGWAGSS